MSSRSRLANVLERVADRLDAIDKAQNTLVAMYGDIRMKLDMVTDDHDQAIARLSGRVKHIERGTDNGTGTGQ